VLKKEGQNSVSGMQHSTLPVQGRQLNLLTTQLLDQRTSVSPSLIVLVIFLL